MAYVWWLVVSAAVVLLLMRFGMRAVGVRDELPVPSAVYEATQPVVEPLYRYFPLTEARFDNHVVEVASLAAAGIVVALGLGVYVVGLLFSRLVYRASTN